METPRPENTFRILIASDIHLGFMESDPIRGNDSVVTFEEILSIAKEKEVDLILHGGDLFHDNKPSRPTLHACLALLRQYCMGDKSIQFEYLSDQSEDFKHCKFPGVNYEDPNMNISIPVFSIHGNHDDPMGHGNLCSLDLLHTAGFVNYFGKATSLDKIQISPLLLQKGDTKLALYGLGSVRDERLHRMFLKKDVTMLRPKDDQDKWFNMFTLHQNRARHSVTSYIPEQFLEDFLDLVIWGHEHECRLKVGPEGVEWNPVQELYVCQPGSSIATSLSEGEMVLKHVGLLQICGKQFQIQSIPLKTVRQFYMDDVVLSKHVDPLKPNSQKLCEAVCEEMVEDLIARAETEHSGYPKQPPQPLIRLRVDYTGFEPFSTQRFGQKFVDKVANPKTMLLFQRQKSDRASGMKNDPNLLARIKAVAVDSARVEDMVAKLVSEGDQLKLLSEKGMSEAVKEFVDKEEREAISELVKYQLKKTRIHLQTRNTSEDQIDDAVFRFKEERKNKKGEVEEEVKEALKEAANKRESQASNGEDSSMISDSEFNEDSRDSSSSIRGRGRGGRGRARGRGRGSKIYKNDDPETDSSTTSTSKRGARGSRGAQNWRGAKASVVSTGKAGTLKQQTMSSSISTRNKQLYSEASEDDPITLDESESDDDWSRTSSHGFSSRKTTNKGSKRPPVILVDDDESEEEQHMNKRKKR